jgi:hypothetical protein
MASSAWPASTARRSPATAVPPPWRSASVRTPIASSAAGWNAAPNSHCGRSTPSSASSRSTAT